jgi:hypothetical protein
MVENLPLKMNPLKLQKSIDRVLDCAFNKGNNDFFLRSRVIGCYNKLFDLVKQIEVLKLKHDSHENSDEISVRKGLICCCRASKCNARQYYSDQI